MKVILTKNDFQIIFNASDFPKVIDVQKKLEKIYRKNKPKKYCWLPKERSCIWDNGSKCNLRGKEKIWGSCEYSCNRVLMLDELPKGPELTTEEIYNLLGVDNSKLEIEEEDDERANG